MHLETVLPPSALRQLQSAEYDAVIIDCPLAGWPAADLLQQIRRLEPSVPVLIRAPEATAAEAFRFAVLGARQLLDPAAARRQVAEAVEDSRGRRSTPGVAAVGNDDWERTLVGSSSAMQQIVHLIRMVGPRRATVLISGETGTGKEVAARALHLAGPRRRGPMVAVNCSALPENLLEAELFGHVRGAFTGAVQNRVGRFEQADGGTLFLDEVGELPLELQAKLLRVLQEREFQRLGSSETVKVDVRVVAATNADLLDAVAHGYFREDLYYRLNVVPMEMPPLRMRTGDIPLLAEHFLRKVCTFERVPQKCIGSEVLERLCGQPWPGNVRQLENAIEMAVALSGERTHLTPADFLPARPSAARNVAVATGASLSLPEEGLDFEATLSAIERSLLDQALRRTGGNKKAAAQILRLKRTTLAAKVRSLAGTPVCN